MSLVLYLCGPINGRQDHECRTWRDYVTMAWKRLGGEVLDPMRRDYRCAIFTPELASELVRDDLEDICNSDALLVCFDVPSVGTSMEILYAAQKGKPIVLVNFSNKRPEQLSPWLIAHSTKIVSSLEEGVTYLHNHFTH